MHITKNKIKQLETGKKKSMMDEDYIFLKGRQRQMELSLPKRWNMS